MKIIIYIFCLWFIPVSSQAAFYQVHSQKLEKLIHNNYDTNFILKKLSQLKSFQSWPKDLNPDLKLYIATKWMDDRYFNEAAQIIDGIYDKVSDSDFYQYIRVNLMVERGLANFVRDDLVALLNKNKKDPDLLLLQSSVYAQSGDYASAIQVLDYLIKKNKRDGVAYLHRGVLKVVALNPVEALQDFAKVEKYLSKNQIHERQQALFQSGLIYMRSQNDMEKAKICFEKGIALDPDSDLVNELKSSLQN